MALHLPCCIEQRMETAQYLPWIVPYIHSYIAVARRADAVHVLAVVIVETAC